MMYTYSVLRNIPFYYESSKRYQYGKRINGKRICKYFKTLKDALCYKYIITLKIKCGLI